MSITSNGYKFVQLKNLKTLIDLIKNKITTKSLATETATIGSDTTINTNGIKTNKVVVGSNSITPTEVNANKITAKSLEVTSIITTGTTGANTATTINNVTSDKGIITELTSDSITAETIKTSDSNVIIDNTGITTDNLKAKNVNTENLNPDCFIDDVQTNNNKTFSSSMIISLLDEKKTEIKNENTRATKAEADLQTSINAETNRATAAENTLTSSIETESKRATDAEKEIADDLTVETGRATVAEEKITSNLTSETNRATAAEEEIASNLTNEITRATEAEDALAKKISDEAARAAAKEDTLDNSIKDNANKIVILNGDSTIEGSVDNKVTAAKTYFATELDKKQNKLIFDEVPAENSVNPVTSGGIYTALVDALKNKTVQRTAFKPGDYGWKKDQIISLSDFFKALNAKYGNNPVLLHCYYAYADHIQIIDGNGGVVNLCNSIDNTGYILVESDGITGEATYALGYATIFLSSEIYTLSMYTGSAADQYNIYAVRKVADASALEELNETIKELKESITAEKERATAAEEELRNIVDNVATDPMSLDF